MNHIPPIYENFDDTHCMQCSLRGVLEFFEPNAVWTWDELDRFTDKEPDKWTWQYRALVNMIDRGYDVVEINTEDMDAYIRDGIYETMVREIGIEAANTMREYCNLVSVIKDINVFHSYVQKNRARYEFRVPTIDDLYRLLAEGYLIISSLNSRKLNDREGYMSHFVLVYGIEDGQVLFQDSGKPMKSEQRVPISKFIAACCDPTPSQWAMTAYRLKSNA